jgi:excisionase family DNA binding protein
MVTTATIPDVLSIREVARLLLTTPGHIRALARAGRLAHLELPGGTLGFLPSDVQAYMHSVRRAAADVTGEARHAG